MKGKNGKAKNRPSRTAKLSLKSVSEIVFKRKEKEVRLNAVLAEEVSPPSGVEGLRWLLLTTEPVDTFEAALKVIRIYAARWRIEDFHKAWKTGCKAEEQRMVTPENLERMLSILGFVAVRLMQLRESFTLPYLLKSEGLVDEAEQVASMPCDKVMTEDEWRLLAFLQGEEVKLESPPTLQWAYLALAKMGGFTDTKGTGVAGWDTLWKGWAKLQERVAGKQAARDMQEKGLLQ